MWSYRSREILLCLARHWQITSIAPKRSNPERMGMLSDSKSLSLSRKMKPRLQSLFTWICSHQFGQWKSGHKVLRLKDDILSVTWFTFGCVTVWKRARVHTHRAPSQADVRTLCTSSGRPCRFLQIFTMLSLAKKLQAQPGKRAQEISWLQNNKSSWFYTKSCRKQEWLILLCLFYRTEGRVYNRQLLRNVPAAWFLLFLSLSVCKQSRCAHKEVFTKCFQAWGGRRVSANETRAKTQMLRVCTQHEVLPLDLTHEMRIQLFLQPDK